MNLINSYVWKSLIMYRYALIYRKFENIFVPNDPERERGRERDRKREEGMKERERERDGK